MNQGKFHALAERLGESRQARIHQRQALPRYKPLFREGETEVLRPSQLSFEDLSPVLEIYQRFDSRAREIEWSVYSGSGEFLLQFGCRLAEGRYEVHSMHPELFLSREEMRGYLEELNRRLGTLYPALELVLNERGEPCLQRRG